MVLIWFRLERDRMLHLRFVQRDIRVGSSRGLRMALLRRQKRQVRWHW
jgi:hypothetical protein